MNRHHTQEFAAASSIVNLENSGTIHTVTLVPVDTCTVETTTSADPEDAGAVWIEWDAGAVLIDTQAVFDGPLTGIRATRTAGVTGGNKMEVSSGG